MFNLSETSLVPNEKLIEVLHSHNLTFEVTAGSIRVIDNTNLKIVVPTTYCVTSPIVLEILEYELTEKSNSPIFIKSLNQKFNVREIDLLFKKLKR